MKILLKNHIEVIVFLGLIISCKPQKTIEKADEKAQVINISVPKTFPALEFPEDNKPTTYRIELGKMLFNDPILSRDSSISCASCHQEKLHFTDGLSISIGIEGRLGIRNAPSLYNVAYQTSMFWDGGNPTLEQQVVAPIDAHFEMDYDINEVVKKLLAHPTYPDLFQKAYQQAPSNFALTRAIACYERTLISGVTKYDKFLLSQDSSMLSASEKNGLKLFFNEQGDCFHCHQGAFMTDFSFQNNGLYETYKDSGRARITQKNYDIGKFKVPSLRNIEHTAPYMHDGSLATLEEVLDHYNSGGKTHPNKSKIIRPLNLTETEKNDIISFLKTLSSEN